MCRIPDSGEESCNPICDSLKFVDHHLHVCSQVLVVLHPDDGGLQPGIWDVNGAVELSLMALRQLDGANSGLEMQMSELIRAQVHP